MPNLSSKLTSFIGIIVILGFVSCYQKIKIEKRKYRKGFNIEFTNNKTSVGKSDVTDLKQNNFRQNQIKSVDSITEKENIDLSSIQYKDSEKSVSLVQIHQQKKETITSKLNHQETKSSRAKTKSLYTENFYSKKTDSNSSFAHIFLLSSITFFGIILFGIGKTIRKRSFQDLKQDAKTNPIKARWKIAGIHLLSGVSAFIAAVLYKNTSINYNLINCISIGMILLPFILIPFNKSKKNKSKQRSFGIFSLMAGATLGSFSVFHSGILSFLTPSLMHSGENEALIVIGKVLLTFMIIGACAGIWYLLGSWACNLACSGYMGAAFAVFYGIGFFNYFLCALAIGHLLKPKMATEEGEKIQNKKIVMVALIVALCIDIVMLALGLI